MGTSYAPGELAGLDLGDVDLAHGHHGFEHPLGHGRIGVGDTFVATEPIELSLLYRDHPNYPLKDDWDILKKLENVPKSCIRRGSSALPNASWNTDSSR